MQKMIFTPMFRIGSFPNLDKPYAKEGTTNVPKYGVKALFPQNGITKPTGRPDSDVSPIIQALNEVCQAEFKCDYATFMQYHANFGVQYPPQFKDGTQELEKDPTTKLPVPGKVRPETAGMWTISFKSADPVDLVAPNGRENISADQMCAGYWARAQISIDAYTNKQNQRVFSIKLINLQLCYQDEKLAMGGGTKIEGTTAFANMAVADSNVVVTAFTGIPQAGTAPVAGLPVPGGLPMPTAAPAAGVPAGVPAMATMPVAGVPAGLPQTAAMMPTQAPTAAPAQFTVPGVQAAPGGVAAIPGMAAPAAAPAQFAVPGMQAAPAAVPAPVAAPPAQAVNTTDRVIMKAGFASLAEHLSIGWTPETLVQHGKADWNYNFVG